MSASIREQLPDHCRDAWDRTWVRLLAPVPDDPSDDPNTDQATEDEPADTAA